MKRGQRLYVFRKRNEYVTVNELRKRCKGREEEQASITDKRKRIMSLHGAPSPKPARDRYAGWNRGGSGTCGCDRGSVSRKVSQGAVPPHLWQRAQWARG